MTIASAIKAASRAAAREVLFGPRKPYSRTPSAKEAMTRQLRDELAAGKLRAVQIALAKERAASEAESEVLSFAAAYLPSEELGKGEGRG